VSFSEAMPEADKHQGRGKAAALIARDEMNLVEVPFTLASNRRATQKTLVFREPATAPNGTPLVREWKVTTPEDYRLPSTDDDLVYLALMQVSYEQGFAERKVFTTHRHILETLGWPTVDGSYRRKLNASLERLEMVTIKCKNSFWNNATRRYEDFKLDDTIRIVSDSHFEKGKGWFTWGEHIWDSIQNGYIKRLNLSFLLELKRPITRQLFRYLDKKFYRQNVLCLSVKTLAFEKLGISRTYKDMAQVRRVLEPALDTLVEKCYLKPYQSEKHPDGLYLILTRTEGWEQQLEFPTLSKVQKVSNNLLVEKLTARGITKSVAHRLATNYPRDRVREKIELFDFLRDTNSPNLGRNPQGWLVRAIEQDYVPPENFTTQAEREEQTQRLKAEEQQQARFEKQRQFDDWLKTTPEQKVKGALIFWQMRFKREQKRPPTAGETETKRQELLEALPTPQQRWQQLFPGEDYPNEA